MMIVTSFHHLMKKVNSNIINLSFLYSIYSIKKFGTNVIPNKDDNTTLKFEFYINKIRCRMKINQFYIMKIIFDNEEDILPIISGDRPKFNFDKYYYKNIKFSDLENKYMQIVIYSLPSNFDIYNGGSLKDLIKKAKLFSTFKIDFLTLAVGPEFHNIILRPPNKKNEQVGRITYTIVCKHLSEIDVKINNVKIQINELLQNNIALSLKYSEKNKKEEQEKVYSNELIPNLNQKEKITAFNYYPKENEKNPLIIKTKSSMIDFTSNDSYLNIYSIRLIKKNSNDNQGFIFENNPELKNNTNINNNLVNHYTKIGYSLLSFLEILSEKDEAMNKQASEFFRHMSGFNKPVSRLSRTKTEETNFIRVFKIQIFQDISRNYITPLYFEGNEIGSCQIDISINFLPSIRQIMCGVLTENGFEINGIHLYDNILIGKGENTLPEEITNLIRIKQNLDTELLNSKENSNNITLLLKDIKKILSIEIEEGCLYYGYSIKTDLFKGQNIMLDIGITVLNIVEKVDKEKRKIIFDILKLINERGEFDLETLSTDWFEGKKNGEEKDDKKIYVFKNDILLKDKIIENFFEFNFRCLNYGLEKINKGKMIENEVKEFALYYINIAYFRIPLFRNKLLEIISTNIEEKFEQIIDRKIKGEKNEIKKEKKSIEDLLEKDPINNLLLWEISFFMKLKISIEYNEKNEKIENDINHKQKKIINLMEEYLTWQEPFLNRGKYFFGFIEKLMNYIIIKAKSTSDINWLNIPGFNTILNCITHEIHIKPTNTYNEQFKKIFRLFITSPEIPNTLIKEIIYKTNIYDVNGIFNIMDIISYLFEEFEKKNSEKKFEKFNYNLLNIIIKHILKVDHSLCVSKIILFYYKYSHLIPIIHLSSVCQNFLGNQFYELFFHWSFEVRDKFFYLILFIFDFKLKNLIPFQDVEDLKIANKEYVGINFNKRFGDILNYKMKLVNEFQKIVQKENKDINYNNKINETKYKNLLVQIPNEVHKNIVVSLDHYNKVKKEFEEFVSDNKNKTLRDMEFPKLILIPPKDDYIEYEK